MATVEVDVSELRAFFDKMGKGSEEFHEEAGKWLDGLGEEFLRVVQDEIIRRQVVDTRLLLHSFYKGDTDNVYEISDGDLTLEVGTTVTYASYVNDGHWTCSKGEQKRFVPGYWDGDRFIYDPSAKGGMVLKQHWVEGKHYWDSALRFINKMMPDLLEAKLNQWLEQFTG